MTRSVELPYPEPDDIPLVEKRLRAIARLAGPHMKGTKRLLAALARLHAEEPEKSAVEATYPLLADLMDCSPSTAFERVKKAAELDLVDVDSNGSDANQYSIQDIELLNQATGPAEGGRGRRVKRSRWQRDGNPRPSATPAPEASDSGSTPPERGSRNRKPPDERLPESDSGIGSMLPELGSRNREHASGKPPDRLPESEAPMDGLMNECHDHGASKLSRKKNWLGHVDRDDLADPAAVDRFYRDAVRARLVSDHQHNRVQVHGAALHALGPSVRSPGALFRSIVSRRQWKFITDEETQRARGIVLRLDRSTPRPPTLFEPREPDGEPLPSEVDRSAFDRRRDEQHRQLLAWTKSRHASEGVPHQVADGDDGPSPRPEGDGT